eukprot:gene19029-24849_t
MSWASLGYGTDGQIPSFVTTNLTILAQNGIIMKNFYAQEVCTPSRAALLTGRYPASIGLQFGLIDLDSPWALNIQETLLPEILKDYGYKNYILGKWHLGSYNPKYLPTARGFHNFTGYVNGQIYPWSKTETSYNEYTDFITSTEYCYSGYDESDLNDYSTSIFNRIALSIIEDHKSGDIPFFLYLPYQNVHDPYYDLTDEYSEGMPSGFISDDVVSQIDSSTSALNRREYLKSLYVFDQAIGEIYNKLVTTGLIDNTYLIFASDNGGCGPSGAFSGPLRGTKGTLFEGGIKVDSFIYSPLLQASSILYDGLFHISDWLPTILSLVDITYEPDSDYQLDGVDHSYAWFDDSLSPRSTLLYNIYSNVQEKSFNIWINGSFAIRNERYKLLHAFNGSTYEKWYESSTVNNDDEPSREVLHGCSQSSSLDDGSFQYYLFDLIDDPYETTNLYDSTDSDIIAVKESLYDSIATVVAKVDEYCEIEKSDSAVTVWSDYDNYVLPWELDDDSSSSYPQYC